MQCTRLSTWRGGEWIAPLDDDDEFTPDHLEVLLEAARVSRAELVYGQMWYENQDGSWRVVGNGSLAEGHICHQAVLYSSRLKFMRYDHHCWVRNEPGDWNMWRRMAELGVPMAFVPRTVGRHYREGSMVGTQSTAMHTDHPTPERFLADLIHTRGELLLSLA